VGGHFAEALPADPLRHYLSLFRRPRCESHSFPPIPMILRLRPVAGVADMLVASGESSSNVSPRLAALYRDDRPSDPARSRLAASCPRRRLGDHCDNRRCQIDKYTRDCTKVGSTDLNTGRHSGVTSAK
jgi:hypothetical protein